jgi:hypothetical protein
MLIVSAGTPGLPGWIRNVTVAFSGSLTIGAGRESVPASGRPFVAG